MITKVLKFQTTDYKFKNNYKMSKNNTLLQIHAEEGSLEEIKRILQLNSHLDLEIKNESGFSALALAIKN